MPVWLLCDIWVSELCSPRLGCKCFIHGAISPDPSSTQSQNLLNVSSHNKLYAEPLLAPSIWGSFICLLMLTELVLCLSYTGGPSGFSEFRGYLIDYYRLGKGKPDCIVTFLPLSGTQLLREIRKVSRTKAFFWHEEVPVREVPFIICEKPDVASVFGQ